jgi:hypothetical protein
MQRSPIFSDAEAAFRTQHDTHASEMDGEPERALMRMPLARLVALSSTEMGKFLRHEPSCDAYAFELFRRAICAQESFAWQALYTQYHDLLRSWVRRHPAWHAGIADDEEWITEAVARFWRSMDPERFRSFPCTASILRYLKLCVHCTLLDDVRARSRISLGTRPLDEQIAGELATPERVSDHLEAQALWDAIRAEVQDETEEVVARSCLVLDLKPREVFETHPAMFSGVDDVYRVKRNLIERLRRSPAIRAFLP